MFKKIFFLFFVICLLFIANKIYLNFEYLIKSFNNNYLSLISLIIISFFFQNLIAFRNIFLLKKYTKISVNFLEWQRIFFNSLLFNSVVILVGTAYRAKVLKNLGISYSKFVTFSYYNYSLYIFCSLLFIILELIFLGYTNLVIFYIFVFSILLFLIIFYFPNILNNLLKFIKFKRIANLIANVFRVIFLVKNIFKNLELLKFSIILVFIVHIFELLIFYIICNMFIENLTLKSFFLLFGAKFILDKLVLTRNLLGFNEILFGLFSSLLGFDLAITTIIKTIHRFIQIIVTLINTLSYNILNKFLQYYKIKTKNFHDK